MDRSSLVANIQCSCLLVGSKQAHRDEKIKSQVKSERVMNRNDLVLVLIGLVGCAPKLVYAINKVTIFGLEYSPNRVQTRLLFIGVGIYIAN